MVPPPPFIPCWRLLITRSSGKPRDPRKIYHSSLSQAIDIRWSLIFRHLTQDQCFEMLTISLFMSCDREGLRSESLLITHRASKPPSKKMKWLLPAHLLQFLKKVSRGQDRTTSVVSFRQLLNVWMFTVWSLKTDFKGSAFCSYHCTLN